MRSSPEHWDELVALVDKVFEWASTSRFASMIQTLMTNKKLAGLSNERLLLELILVLFPDRIFLVLRGSVGKGKLTDRDRVNW